MISIPRFRCKCKRNKEVKLTFNGGSTGKYVLELCRKCRLEESNEYLLEEELA